MKRHLYKTVYGLFFIWILWSCLLSSCEVTKMKIPMKLHLYGEEAVSVLSGTQKKLSPEELHLDFNGNIELTKVAEGSYTADCKLFGVIPVKKMEIEIVSRQELIPGGIPVGIYVQTDGVFVIGTGQIETPQGTVGSPAENIVKTGDYITAFQGEKISNKRELVEKLEEFEGEEAVLELRRNAEKLQVAVRPVYTGKGAQLGIWVRDDTQGVGTLTYLTQDGKFGALGHGISDTDSELLMEVSDGRLYDCEILDIIKGERGKPGKVSGKITYGKNHLYGTISGNLSGGIYGTADQRLKASVKGEPVPIALKQEVEEGEAVILSSVGGFLQEYTVDIRKIHRGEKDVNKGMELTVTDERLLELTGGIVQGMSGSPILQNGKIVGAVTHVFVNDPTKGYGIFIENMLEH